ncbi:beta-glucosidase BglX [Granulicella arctica]|uniref:beta-glucosidase BglX n=1 Tax=Granulicella arctica TaxID=940613 RepID=UPI0021DFB6A9|nr:beta-glucosidase BglX [Granulicella arctica]
MYASALRRSTLFVAIAFFTLASAGLPLLNPVFAAPTTSEGNDVAASRVVEGLLKKMTLEEKIGQMSQVALNQPQTISPEEQARQGVGSFLFITDPARINHLQHVAVEQSRLHIPLIFGFDVIHGFRTIYPVPLALAASWDPKVAEHAQHMAAREARAAGVNWTFAPMVDIARDARWGRIMEGAGEDPYLGARMAEAQIHGFQGETLGGPDSLLACVKHFAGYGAAVGGRDYEESNISDEQLWNVYLPPFEAAVDAGSGTLMTAYMDLNGVPAAGNNWLLHDVLRDKWHFNGFVVSDWDAVKSLTVHGFAADDADAAARAVNAGIDMEMTSHVYRDQLAAAVKDGRVSQATVDEAVRRILTVKYRLGLFSSPYINVEEAPSRMVTQEQRTASRLAAERSAVLLRNENQILPLKTSGTVALIGPLIDSKADIMGSWSLAAHQADSVTVLDGMKRYTASHPALKIVSTVGVEIERGQPSIFDEQFASPKPKFATDDQRQREFAHAIELVKSSDVAVLVLGESQDMSGERASRSTLTLPGKQEQLLEAAVATGKPIVLLLMNGRPLDITWASSHVAAILDDWYPGTDGGNAIANLLFGEAVPGGKLPVSWPRTVGQEPLYYGENLTQIPDAPNTRYWDGSSAPLYPFGFGLSYSTFTLGNLKSSASTMHTTGSITMSCDVTNIGKIAADEVVQIYTHQRAGSASRPVRELKGFKRVTLKAGEHQTVSIKVDAQELAFWSPQTHKRSVEPGVFDLWVGNSSQATTHTTFAVK